MHRDSRTFSQIFEEDYDRIRRWAIRITRQDELSAEEIVHEVYLKLHDQEVKPTIQNIDSYIFVSLKNHHNSRVKRNAGERQVSIDGDELSQTAALSFNPLDQIKTKDQLRAVCQYACIRKDSSISGSILILKFFHGYYLSEIARICRRTRNAVESRLVTIRPELLEYLANPEAHKRKRISEHNLRKTTRLQSDATLLNELRRKIFASTREKCSSPAELAAIYISNTLKPNRRFLGHIVSCRTCLEQSNGLLKLPALDRRDPLDFLRQSQNWQSGLFMVVLSLLEFISCNSEWMFC